MIMLLSHDTQFHSEIENNAHQDPEYFPFIFSTCTSFTMCAHIVLINETDSLNRHGPHNFETSRYVCLNSSAVKV